MRVGFLGLGRLGLPIAAVLSQHHEVSGYDPDPRTAERLKVGHPWEVGLAPYLGKVGLASRAEDLSDSDVVVVAVQTPHDPLLDGTHTTDVRAPFDTTYIEAALKSIGHGPPIVVMSTLLPGDCRRLAPLVSELIYSPQFIAMGSTVEDFLDPEFVLGGTEDGELSKIIEALLVWVIGPFDHFNCTWETAELAKMAYNTAIGMKLALANTVGWLADEVGADGGEVMRILGHAHNRITSPAYLSPGLGDGGACHPRDQLALSWLARQHGVYDLFSAIIDQRDAHSEWIAEIAERYDPEPFILGAAYKANSSLIDGSPALLLANQTGWDIGEELPDDPRTVIIGVPHDEYRTMDFTGHTVIDPWGIVPGSIQPGRRPPH